MSRRRRTQPPEEGPPEGRASPERDLSMRAAVLTVGAFFGLALLVTGGVLGGMLIHSLATGRSDEPRSVAVVEPPHLEQPRAAIVDQLNLRYPNPSFVQDSTRMLQQAGYAVDYYSGEQVTVDFYRDLPTHGYELVVLRAHATRTQAVFQSRQVDTVQLFTSEPFDFDRYVEERDAGTVGFVAEYEGEGLFFGITADFITSSMEGAFDDAVIVIMGCEGLSIDATAEAFVQNGAKAVIGWDGLVSAAHTDAATARLLEHLVTHRLSAENAVARTMDEVGPDPDYDSVLLSYPAEG